MVPAPERDPDKASPGADTAWSGTVPKLSLPQRMLAALPQIRKDKTVDGAGTASATSGSGSTTTPTRSTGSDDDLSDAPSDDEPASGPGASVASRRASAPARAHPDDDKSPAELEHMIKRIDARERKFALFAAPIGAAFGVALTVAALRSHSKDLTGLILYEGVVPVVFAALVLIAVRTRRRSFVAFSLIFMGLPVLPYGILFAGLGIWMILRAQKWQRILTAKTGRPRARSTGASAKGSRTSVRDASTRGSAAASARRRKRREPEVKGPSPSKRYTPPKPPRPRPPKPEE
jgi:hypothetical protein